ncbi:MAG TPA: SRPBCC domain-containing protein [Chryseolinea sp.]|nr:SRPBCC domain-containing protein [Chryseolinea sp.]
MEKRIITQSIEINAPVNKVWRVFTDPKVTRQMGGEYVTDWKVGSAFGWKGSDGKMYTNCSILQIERKAFKTQSLRNRKGKSIVGYCVQL